MNWKSAGASVLVVISTASAGLAMAEGSGPRWFHAEGGISASTFEADSRYVWTSGTYLGVLGMSRPLLPALRLFAEGLYERTGPMAPAKTRQVATFSDKTPPTRLRSWSGSNST
jgi:hypothetical protein